MADKDQTIIIKKIKKGGHGHHGGAWKVAYADFVTAMMAFFLLLWLLTSTPVENLQGLADYFSPTLGLQGKLGIGFKGGRAPNTEGYSNGDWASKGLIFGAPPSGPLIRFPDSQEQDLRDNPKVAFISVSDEGLQNGMESAFNNYQNVNTEVTPEGIEITISNRDNAPLFKEGTDVPLPAFEETIAGAARLIRAMPHYIMISAHTGRGETLPRKTFPSLWELSVGRALAVRRLFTEHGMDEEQVAAVTGHADHELIYADNAESPANFRIVILLLTKSRAGVDKQVAPEHILFE